MKFNFYLIGLVLMILSCKSSQISNDKEFITKNKIINSYKQRVFIECLKASFENDSIFYLIRKEDFFDSSDFFSFQMIDKARMLGNEVAKKIPEYDTHCDDCLSKKKKTIFASCLNYYMSKELDSISKIECEKYFE